MAEPTPNRKSWLHAAKLPSLSLPRLRKGQPGMSPGVESHELGHLTDPPQPREPVRIHCIDYSPQRVAMQDVTNLAELLSQPRPLWAKARWINVEGVHDTAVLQQFVDRYQLHPLAVEDMLHMPQRPKLDIFPAQDQSPQRLFVIARMLYLVGSQLINEQVSLFLGPHTLLTFQEASGDVWEPIRQRLHQEGSRLRRHDVSFLFYALLDAMVDHCFPILEHYGNRLEDLEEVILQDASPKAIHHIHRIKRDLLLLRRVAWPMREVINSLQRDPPPHLSKTTQTYLRDVYDHVIQIIDLIETYRELAASLTETYMTAMSNRMNQVMKLLTIIATIFIPLTFLAGVYGMNFQYMPELAWKWAYPAIWGVFGLTVGVMLWWFRRKQWL